MTIPATPFRCLLSLEPLGLLYGSAGRFLSAENLTGRSGEHFPPDSPALAGLVAAQLHAEGRGGEVRELLTSGPFWLELDDINRKGEVDPLLPAPLNLLQKSVGAGENTAGELGRSPDAAGPPLQQGNGSRRGKGKKEADPGRRKRKRSRRVVAKLQPGEQGWSLPEGDDMPGKPLRGGWIRLSQWEQQQRLDRIEVCSDPWKPVPHLHPRLQAEQRCSAGEAALFLEYGIALRPGAALAYLSSHEIREGRYRFGGEGHLVELRCHQVPEAFSRLLSQPLAGSFALVTPAVWGSRRMSEREPLDTSRRPALWPWHHNRAGPLLLTDRPRPWRYRIGGGSSGRSRLSRGRWAVPAGTCYQLPGGLRLPPWPAWEKSWFPREGLSLRQFGTALALPLHLP